MEVTKSNFQELLPEIKETITEASFLCVDGEFTGLNSENNITTFDTPSQYYNKLRHGAMDFLFVQFGMAAFKHVPDTQKYKCKVYNFYIFPRPMNRSAPDYRFLCQSSSIDFLASNGFDFNKLFKEGIPYLSKTDEDALRDTMAEKRKYFAANNANSTPVDIPDQFKEQVNNAINRIAELLSPDFNEEELHIDKCGAFVRKLIYQSVRERFPNNEVLVQTKQGVLVVTKQKTGLTKEELEAEASEKEEQKIQEAVGFSHVIRSIAASEKLLIGHNMLLDLCHMVNQFCYPLPPQYLDFKAMLHCLFPRIIDTKYLVNNSEELKEVIKSSVLEHVFQATKDKPFSRPDISCDEGYLYNVENDKQHEAGYDAFITGVSFISLISYLQSLKNEDKPVNESTVLEEYINRLCLMRTPDTCIHLGSFDPEPNRSHVFHVTFPKSWTSENLIELFSAYGNIQIVWSTDTTAWVSLFNKKDAPKVMKSLCIGGQVGGGALVRTYVSYQNHCMVDSPRPPSAKRKSPTQEAQQKPVKRRRISPQGPRIETIPEEAEESTNEADSLSTLEMDATNVSTTSATFDVDSSWD